MREDWVDMAMWWPLLVATGNMLFAAVSLFVTLVGGVVIVRWCWRVAMKNKADE